MANPLEHREGLTDRQIEVLDDNGTEFYRMLVRALHNNVLSEFKKEVGNQLNSPTWSSDSNTDNE